MLNDKAIAEQRRSHALRGPLLKAAMQHRLALKNRGGLVAHLRHQAERQKAVRDRAAEGRLRRRLRVDVDELVVLCAVREGVDAVLVDQDPVGDADLLAGTGLELRRGDGLAALHE